MGESKIKKRGGAKPGKRLSKPVLTAVIIAVCVAGIAAVDYAQRAKQPPKSEKFAERSMGNPSAPIKIVEFIDFQCQHCALGYKHIKRYMKSHPDKIYLTTRYYPLGQPNSMISALYAECSARQGKFWEYQDAALENQPRWRALPDPRPMLDYLAGQAGVDLLQLNQCLKNDDARATVQKDKLYGQSYFIQSTPTYFVNDQMVVGAPALRDLLEATFRDPL